MENFEDFLKDQANEFRMKPSGKVWEGVEAGLNRPRKRVIWIYYGAAALVLAVLSCYLVYRTSTPEMTHQPMQQEQTPVPDYHNGCVLELPSSHTGSKASTESIVVAPALKKQQGNSVKQESKQKETTTTTDRDWSFGTFIHMERIPFFLHLPGDPEVHFNALEKVNVKATVYHPEKKDHFEILAGTNLTYPIQTGSLSRFTKSSSGFHLGINYTRVLNPFMKFSIGAGYQQNSYRLGVIETGPNSFQLKSKQSNSLQISNYRLNNENYERNNLYLLVVPVNLYTKLANYRKVELVLTTGIDLTRVFTESYLIKNPDNDLVFTNRSFIRHYNGYGSAGLMMIMKPERKINPVFGYRVQMQILDTYSNSFDAHERFVVHGVYTGIRF